MIIRPGDRVLFQGDSITDCDRSREGENVNANLGSGYAAMVAAQLLARRPADRLSFLNRGVGGDRSVDLYARIRADVINLRPDVLSVLIGVNDTWHGFAWNNGVSVAKFGQVYRAFLDEVRQALPAIRLVLCEPFVLPCGVVQPGWIAEMNERRPVVAKLAAELGAAYVPFQTMFAAALKEAPPAYWADDGVHPTPAGHYRMAQLWLEAAG